MYREELTQIAQTIWESVLQMPLEPADGTPPAADAATLVASISFSGAWHGEVMATLSEALGRRIAGAMLHLDPGSVAAEDVLDAIGEIVNMLGGNVKALMPPPCQLSLPRVTTVRIGSAAEEQAEPRESLHFRCDDYPIEIALRAAPLPNFHLPAAGA